MKRMIAWIFIGVGVLAVGGLVVLRHVARKAGEVPAPRPAAARDGAAFDAWQGSMRVAPPAGYETDAETKRRLREKLRAEEMRQRPWEGRN